MQGAAVERVGSCGREPRTALLIGAALLGLVGPPPVLEFLLPDLGRLPLAIEAAVPEQAPQGEDFRTALLAGAAIERVVPWVVVGQVDPGLMVGVLRAVLLGRQALDPQTGNTSCASGSLVARA